MSEPTVAEWVRSDDPQPHPALIDAGISERLQPLGRRLAALQSFAGVDIRQATEADRTEADGLALGLTRDEIREVVAEWSAFYSARLEPMNWHMVRLSLRCRAEGKPHAPAQVLWAQLRKSMQAFMDDVARKWSAFRQAWSFLTPAYRRELLRATRRRPAHITAMHAAYRRKTRNRR